jgi:hypothetical protein
MKNVHLLPTEKPSRLMIDTIENKLYLQPILHKKTINVLPQHIYITSDELIKDVRPYKGKWQLEQGEILNKFPTYLTDLSECKLVIMTTDQDLINDGVQAIDDEFLEWFVKNPTCEFVNVKKIRLTREITLEEYLAGKFPEVIEGAFSDRKPYKIIFPQERLSTKLKNVLDNMTQEKFDQEWKKVTDLNLEGPSIIPPEKHIQFINNNIEEFDGQVEEFKKKEKSKKYPIEETIEEAAEKHYEEQSKSFENDEEDPIFDISRYLVCGFIDGAKWQAERMYIEIEQKWLEYRSNTNNEDAWCFKEWLVEQFKSE